MNAEQLEKWKAQSEKVIQEAVALDFKAPFNEFLVELHRVVTKEH